MFVPIIVMIFAMGVFPGKFLKVTEPAVDTFITTFKSRLGEPDGPRRIRGQSPTPDAPAPTPERVPAGGGER